MKKIIKSSVLLFGVCLIAGTASAQLSSDAPSLTATKVADIQKKQAIALNAKPVESVQTASSVKASPIPKAATVKTVAVDETVVSQKVMAPVAANAAKIPTISDQGTYVPVTATATEVKTAPVVTQGTVEPVKMSEVKLPPVTKQGGN